MVIDWSVVTIDHVRKACERFDSTQCPPERQAMNTFLMMEGKEYPAKYIRGGDVPRKRPGCQLGLITSRTLMKMELLREGKNRDFARSCRSASQAGMTCSNKMRSRLHLGQSTFSGRLTSTCIGNATK